jgi:hypothetical protein
MNDAIIEAVTLFTREDGADLEKSMKPGRHEDGMYLNGDNELKLETAEVVELDEPTSVLALNGASDYPPRVQEFFGVEGEQP